MLRILHHVFALSATFGMIYLYTAEIFPTVTRSTAVGLSSSFARIGGVIAPFIGSLNDILGPQVPLAVFGICLLYTSPSPRDRQKSRMPSSA